MKTRTLVKKRINKYLLVWTVAYVFMFLPSLYAQIDFRAGYIVKNAGDTVKGFVVYRVDKKNIEGCTFKESRKGTVTNYVAVDIAGFGIFGDKSYQSFELPKDAPVTGRVFTKALVRGHLSLYRHKNFFLVKQNDSLSTLPIPKEKVLGKPGDLKLQKDKKYLGVLTYLMLDCPMMNTGTTSYAEGPLSQLVYLYDQCKKQGRTIRNSRPMGKVGLSVVIGYQNSVLLYDAVQVIPFKGSTVLGGVGIDLSSPRVYDKLFFTIDAWYSKNFYQGYYEGTYGGDPLKEDIYAEFISLKIPFGVKYNFRRSDNTPYIRLGALWNNTKQSSIKTVSTRETSGGVLTDEFFGRYQIKNPKGYWASIGYDKRVFKKVQIFSEFRYERTEGYMGSPVVNDSRMVNYNFLIGLKF